MYIYIIYYHTLREVDRNKKYCIVFVLRLFKLAKTSSSKIDDDAGFRLAGPTVASRYSLHPPLTLSSSPSNVSG